MPQIVVATLNIHNRQDRWLERRNLIVAEFVDTQPDLISLQEINRPVGQGRWLRNQINSRLSGQSGHPYRLIQKRKQHIVHGYFEGIGILSKLPILSHDSLSLGFGGRVALRVNIELPSRETLDFVATHLHNVADEREARVEQVMRLIGWLNERNPVPLQVIAGDFNEIPSGPAIQQMRQTYHSAFREAHGYDPIATYPTFLARRQDGWAGCLDYIFISSAIERVLKARIFCNNASAQDSTLYPSDHVGLVVSLEIRNGPAERAVDSHGLEPLVDEVET